VPNADQSRRQKAPAHTLMRSAAFAKPATWSRGFSTTGILHRTHGAVRSAAGIAGRNFPLAQLFIASLIAADANKQRSAARFDDIGWEAIARTRRSVQEYLDTLDEAAWGAASESVPTSSASCASTGSG